MLMVAPEQLQQQFGFAGEIGIEGAAGIAGLFGDVFHAGGHEALGNEYGLGGVEQALARLIAALLSG